MKSIAFLDYILDNINEPINYHNTYFNKYWNKHETKLTLLLNKLINQIINIKNSFNITELNKSQIEHIIWKPIQHKYPISYSHYIDSYKHIDYDTYINKFNTRDIPFEYNTDYTNYLNTFITNKIIRDIYNKFQNGIFISLDVRLYVENNINNCLIYSFPHIDLYILYNDTNLDEKTKQNLLKNIYIISKWIHNLNPIKKITLYYFDTLLPKQIINSYNYLCSQNINSGLSSNNYIIMWRREEIFKVLIHELIHFLNIDIKHSNIDNIINYKIGNINYPILINEAITELQAQLFHTLYIITINNNNNLIELIKIFYNLEQLFSLYQFSKIMNFYSINSFDINLIKSNFNQSSNAYSYYILKTILNMHFFDVLYELKYIKKLLNNNNECHIENKIKNIIDNLPIVFLNKIIKDFKIIDNSLKLTLFSYY